MISKSVLNVNIVVVVFFKSDATAEVLMLTEVLNALGCFLLCPHGSVETCTAAGWSS